MRRPTWSPTAIAVGVLALLVCVNGWLAKDEYDFSRKVPHGPPEISHAVLVPSSCAAFLGDALVAIQGRRLRVWDAQGMGQDIETPGAPDWVGMLPDGRVGVVTGKGPVLLSAWTAQGLIRVRDLVAYEPLDVPRKPLDAREAEKTWLATDDGVAWVPAPPDFDLELPSLPVGSDSTPPSSRRLSAAYLIYDEKGLFGQDLLGGLTRVDQTGRTSLPATLGDARTPVAPGPTSESTWVTLREAKEGKKEEAWSAVRVQWTPTPTIDRALRLGGKPVAMISDARGVALIYASQADASAPVHTTLVAFDHEGRPAFSHPLPWSSTRCLALSPDRVGVVVEGDTLVVDRRTGRKQERE